MDTPYEAVGGMVGLSRLAEAWHRRVVDDEVVGHAFSHGFADDHVERLASYWAEALGGPDLYSSRYGNEAAVVRIHSGNGEHDEMNHRAVDCFDAALEDVGVTDPRLAGTLHDYFAWATWTTMYRHHGSADAVLEGTAIPRWSWDGLVTSGS